jgi:transposase
MTKVKTSVLFKQYDQQQIFLLPPSLDELIESCHLVRVVNEVVESMDIAALINQYEGGGTTAYHPRMVLKVLLYAYCMKIYTGRKIARALKQDIHFMWLAAMNRPDFRTINNFRSGKAKQAIESLFKEMLVFLMDHGYIKMENYFCDGSSFTADANRHKMVWKKNAERYKQITEDKCRELFAQIDDLNAADEKWYGDKDHEEAGSHSTINAEAIAAQVNKLNEVIVTATGKKEKRKAGSLKKELQKNQVAICKYEDQIKTAGNRSGYNQTDRDASAMRMKNEEILPGYNVLAGSEDQFIVNCSVHQSTNDATCFSEHIAQLEKHSKTLPGAITADSIFGTEQNYELLESKSINSYMKFPTFYSENKRKYQNNPFVKENFKYDVVTDCYTCPNNRRLTLRGNSEVYKATGYKSTLKIYECESCRQCPWHTQCCTSETQGNRTIKVNEKLENYKQQARQNLNSEKGIILRKQRGVDIESCFGDIKHNMNFRRFHVRGLEKVKTEWTIVAMAHNLKKIHLQNIKKVA